MKLMFYLLTLLLTLPNLRSFSYVSRNLCQKTSKLITNWPSTLAEKIRRFSYEKSCETNLHCRNYQEILDLTACKANRMANLLPLDKDLYYLMTDFKPKGILEFAKFIYAIIDNKFPITPTYKGEIQFVKICVPVNAEKKIFIDVACPLDECEEKCSAKKPCKIQQNPENVKRTFQQLLNSSSKAAFF